MGPTSKGRKGKGEREGRVGEKREGRGREERKGKGRGKFTPWLLGGVRP